MKALELCRKKGLMLVSGSGVDIYFYDDVRYCSLYLDAFSGTEWVLYHVGTVFSA